MLAISDTLAFVHIDASYSKHPLDQQDHQPTFYWAANSTFGTNDTIAFRDDVSELIEIHKMYAHVLKAHKAASL